MAPVVLLHIGAMKTGTTYLQNLLTSNRDRLAEQGWSVPTQADQVVTGVRQVLGLTDAGGRTAGHTPVWDRLTEQLRGCTGAGSLVSMEFLSYARPATAQRIVDDLSGTDLHVVLTVRDAAAAIPSQWQSLSRNRGVASWPDFAVQARSSAGGEPTPAGRAFRRTQDIPRMLRVWSSVEPAPRLTVVTVPASSASRDLLWQRLVSVAGIDPSTTSTTLEAFDNPRLGYASCDLLRRLNAAGLRSVPPSDYRRVVRHVARHHLLRLRQEESTPRLDHATARFAADLNRRTRRVIGERAELVGDLADLPVTVPWRHRVGPQTRPRPVPDAEVLRAADVARTGLLAYLDEQDLTVPDAAGQPPTDLEDAVRRVAALMRTAMEA